MGMVRSLPARNFTPTGFLGSSPLCKKKKRNPTSKNIRTTTKPTLWRWSWRIICYFFDFPVKECLSLFLRQHYSTGLISWRAIVWRKIRHVIIIDLWRSKNCWRRGCGGYWFGWNEWRCYWCAVAKTELERMSERIWGWNSNWHERSSWGQQCRIYRRNKWSGWRGCQVWQNSIQGIAYRRKRVRASLLHLSEHRCENRIMKIKAAGCCALGSIATLQINKTLIFLFFCAITISHTGVGGWPPVWGRIFISGW
jgi:hypothetical protein